jgi:alkylation response protein AidB-like acyl-CoA dehydrogenase
VIAEDTGRSPRLAPAAMECLPPDTGNTELLHLPGTPEQRAQWLDPLAGTIRSAFSMTEPDVTSFDATNIAATVGALRRRVRSQTREMVHDRRCGPALQTADPAGTLRSGRATTPSACDPAHPAGCPRRERTSSDAALLRAAGPSRNRIKRSTGACSQCASRSGARLHVGPGLARPGGRPVIAPAIQLHGLAGVADDVPLAMISSRARTLRIVDGTDDVHLCTVAREQLRRYRNPR